MRSARTFYRLSVALGAAGALAVALTLAVALRAVDFAIPTGAELQAACDRMLPSGLTAGSLLVLALATLSLIVLARGARSLARQLRARRRVAETLVLHGSITHTPRPALVIDDPRPQAFCLGFLHPRIYVSTGACERLNPAELAAVLGHEAHHARRRDPLRLLIVGVLADALFFLPVLRRLRHRYAALAELAADEAAVHVSRDPQPLASALLSFGEGAYPGVVGIAPERVDQLLGETPRWQLPLSLVLGALVTLTGLFALIVILAGLIAPGRVGVALLSAELCMIAMTLGPVLLAASLLVLSRQTFIRARR